MKTDNHGLIIITVIPCFNEQKYVAEVVRRAENHCNAAIVADDNSADLTVCEASEAGALVSDK